MSRIDFKDLQPLEQAYYNMLESKEGRAVLYNIIYIKCGFEEDAYVVGDINASVRAEGRRSVAIDLLKIIKTLDNDNYFLMLRENDHLLTTEGQHDAE